MMSTITSLGTWNWFIVGGLLLAIEVMAPGTFMLWLGLSALLVGIISLFVDWPWQMQFVTFAVFAVAVIPIWHRVDRRVEAPRRADAQPARRALSAARPFPWATSRSCTARGASPSTTARARGTIRTGGYGVARRPTGHADGVRARAAASLRSTRARQRRTALSSARGALRCRAGDDGGVEPVAAGKPHRVRRRRHAADRGRVRCRPVARRPRPAGGASSGC